MIAKQKAAANQPSVDGQDGANGKGVQVIGSGNTENTSTTNNINVYNKDQLNLDFFKSLLDQTGTNTGATGQ